MVYKKKRGGNGKRICHFCDKKMANLPRHLRDEHKFDQRSSLVYAEGMKSDNKKNTRKDSTTDVVSENISEMKREMSRRNICPVEGCGSFVKRIDKHLIGGKHKMIQSDPAYKQFLESMRTSAATVRPTFTPVTQAQFVDDNTRKNIEKNAVEKMDTDSHDPPATTNTCIDVYLQKEINSFFRWLQSFGGGDKTSERAMQMADHVKHVLAVYGQNFKSEMVTENLMNIEVNFIGTSLESKQASTVKNYLLDFKKFTEWAKLMHKEWIEMETADRIIYQVQLWNRSLQKKIRKRFATMKLEHRKTLVTIADIKLYLKGKRARMGRDVLSGKVAQIRRKNEKENESEVDDEAIIINRIRYVGARNYLIMLLVINNATRAGPLTNLKICEVDAARENIHDDRNVINVEQHKTLSLYGAAQLSLASEYFVLLAAFVDKIRPLIPNFEHSKHGNRSSNVFLTWKGQPLNQSQLANIITTEMAKVAMKKSRTNCTVMRKSIVCLMLQSNLGAWNEQDLASLMKHSEHMQKRTYDVRCSDRNMARMSNLVWKVMTGEEVNSHELSRPK